MSVYPHICPLSFSKKYNLEYFDSISVTDYRVHTCFFMHYHLLVPRMLFEHKADRPSILNLLRDSASVNSMKQTCVIVILAYFTLFQPNLH